MMITEAAHHSYAFLNSQSVVRVSSVAAVINKTQKKNPFSRKKKRHGDFDAARSALDSLLGPRYLSWMFNLNTEESKEKNQAPIASIRLSWTNLL